MGDLKVETVKTGLVVVSPATGHSSAAVAAPGTRLDIL